MKNEIEIIVDNIPYTIDRNENKGIGGEGSIHLLKQEEVVKIFFEKTLEEDIYKIEKANALPLTPTKSRSTVLSIIFFIIFLF